MVNSRCFRYLVWFFLVWSSSFCFGQVVKVRVINGKDWLPLPKQQVLVSLLYENGEKSDKV